MNNRYKNIISRLLILISITFLLLVGNIFYIVDQRKYAVVFQFGEAIDLKKNPGLYLKLPFIHTVNYFDKRILYVFAEAKELTASDGKRIIVDAFAYFKIEDPIKFYSTVRDYKAINIRLNKILESSMRKVIGQSPLVSLLSSKRSALMSEIWNMLKEEALSFGVNIIDVRIVRADLHKENSDAIYKRMQTERNKQARKIRAEGHEEAAQIRSEADKQKSFILSEAYMKSQIIKGEGDSISAQIYNSTYSQDYDFFNIYTKLEAYKNSLSNDNTTFVLPSNSKFLKELNLFNTNNLLETK